MLRDHYHNKPTDQPTAQSLILTEADALFSFWPEVRDDDTLGPDEAFNLLSVWGHLRRFAPTSLDTTLTGSFNRLIDDELEVICRRAIEVVFPADWVEASAQLEETWDLVTDHDSIYEIERCVREQFKILDRASLMAYSIAKLQPTVVSHQKFIALKSSVIAAEDFLADHPDVFLSAAVFASAMLDSYRTDLHTFDEELAETSLKHRILQRLIDEQQTPSKPIAIPREAAVELMGVIGTFPKDNDSHNISSSVSITARGCEEESHKEKQPACKTPDLNRDQLGGWRSLDVAFLLDSYTPSDDVCVYPAKNPSESSPESILAMALNENNPTDSRDSTAAMAWYFKIDSSRVHWETGGVQEGSVVLNIEWHEKPDPRLLIRTDGIFRRGHAYEISALWLSESREVIAESGVLRKRSTLTVPSPLNRQPKTRDFLVIRHRFANNAQTGYVVVRL